MREIKYKAWLPGIKKMTYAHTLDELMNWNTKPEGNGSAVWLQYTGLEDRTGKDGHHKDLWEFHGVVYTVEWDDDEARFYLKHPDRNAGPDDHIKMMHFRNGEIIGNIYENPGEVEHG